MSDTHANYLRDLGSALRADAVDARRESERGGDFERGQAFAFYRVISLMQQQADAFGLSRREVALEGLDPERDLLGS